MSNYDQFDADRLLREQLDEARSAGRWIPWACSTLALGWWGGAAAYVIGKMGVDALMELPPAELGGGAALALAPGLALVLAGVMGRESVRSSHANAVVLQASNALLSPGRYHTEEMTRLSDLIRKASQDIAEQLGEAEARVQVLRQDLDVGANSAFKAAEVVRADSDALRGKLAEEREALMRLSEDMRKQMTSLSDSLPLHVENLTRASAQAQSDVRQAGRELDERLSSVEETGKALASRVAQIDQMTAETRKRAQNLVSALVSINEQLLGSSKTVDNAIRAGDLAVQASRSTADAIRSAMDSALDGARETVEGLNNQASRAKAESQAAIERLETAGKRAETAVKAATDAANRHATETEARMDLMSDRMYQAALKSTQAAESGLERARQRIERASVLLNGMDDSGAAPAPVPAPAPVQPSMPQAPARIVRPDRPSAPQAFEPPSPVAPVAPPSPQIHDLDEDILGPETPPPPRPASRLNIQNLVPFDPLEDDDHNEIEGMPPPRPPQAAPQPAPAPVQASQPLPPRSPPAMSASSLPRLHPDIPVKPVAASRPMPSDDFGPVSDIGRPSNSDMTWRDLLSSIDEPDGRNETAMAFVDQLGRAGIRLKRAIRSADLRRIALATTRGERHRRKATRQAAPGELQQIERLLRQDHDLRIAAESYLALEEPDAMKFLSNAERTRDDAGPRLAAYLLLDAALG